MEPIFIIIQAFHGRIENEPIQANLGSVLNSMLLGSCLAL
jgi:hypothetical protein